MYDLHDYNNSIQENEKERWEAWASQIGGSQLCNIVKMVKYLAMSDLL